MAECSSCLPLSQAQLEVVKRVLGKQAAEPVLQVTAVHHCRPVMRYGIFPPHKKRPDVHALYMVDIPDGLGQLRVFFTDEQKKQMVEEGVEPCDFVEVEAADLKLPAGVRYGIVLPPAGLKYGIPPSAGA